jgi:hypothetical protein
MDRVVKDGSMLRLNVEERNLFAFSSALNLLSISVVWFLSLLHGRLEFIIEHRVRIQRLLRGRRRVDHDRVMVRFDVV